MDKPLITKIGFVTTLVTSNTQRHILLVRKRGTALFILPGGKPEPGESAEQTLRREVREELGCEVGPLYFDRSFTDKAANEPGQLVCVQIATGTLLGTPVAQNEIEELLWYAEGDVDVNLAPSLRNQILPYVWRELFV